jgi:hypothetical protein
MSENSSINTLIGTFSAIGSITSRNIDPSNLICIDTQNNRIGINTINPSHSITIVDSSSNINGNRYIGIYSPRLYFDLSWLPTSKADAVIGQVYIDGSNETLKVKLRETL